MHSQVISPGSPPTLGFYKGATEPLYLQFYSNKSLEFDSLNLKPESVSVAGWEYNNYMRLGHMPTPLLNLGV